MKLKQIMKKKFLYFKIFILLIPLLSFIRIEKYSNNTTSQPLFISAVKLDANQISTWFRNNCEFNRSPQSNPGFEWPAGSNLFARYDGAVWMGGVVNNDTLTSCLLYGYSDFVNGYIDDFGVSQGMNDSIYRIYKIYKGDSLSSDYLNWPVNQGAYTNNIGKPYCLGKQTMFYVFNDNYIRNSLQTSDSSMKAQILQTNWAYDHSVYLENVIFTEYRIINRSKYVWYNYFFGIWNDDDPEGVQLGKVACDTLRNLGYNYFVYNSQQYGTKPPAVGNLFLKGLSTFTGNSNDTVKYYNPPGSNNLIVKAGYKDLKLKVWNRFNNASFPPAPENNIETFRVISGHQSNGSDWINPINNTPSTLLYPGDPVTNSGWIQTGAAYRNTFMGTGPATVHPGDTVSVLYAQLIARGSSNLNSITKLRETADHVKQIYNENFQSVLSVKNISDEVPDGFILDQNYPNPFNPVTNLEFGISKLGFVSLKIYDILGKEIATLVNENLNPGTYKYTFDASDLTSGIYFYRLQVGKFSETRRMILLK